VGQIENANSKAGSIFGMSESSRHFAWWSYKKCCNATTKFI